MKGAGLAACFLVLASPSAHAAGRYILMSASDRNDAYLVDSQTVSLNKAWVYSVSPTLYFDKTDKYFYTFSISRIEFDCTGRRSRALSLTHKDSSGKTLYDRDNFGGDWSLVKPDTVYEPILDYVCQKKMPVFGLSYEDVDSALRAFIELTRSGSK